MSFDEAFDAALQPLREEIAELRARLDVQERDLRRPIYDAKQLQDDLGFSKHEAYRVLRAHGVILGGRRRISATDLTRIFSKAESFSAPERLPRNEKRASALN